MQLLRRDFLTATALLLGAGSAGAEIGSAIGDIRLDGRIGVTALDTGSGVHIRHRSDERFAMCSTFKVALVAAVLARTQRGEIGSGDLVRFGAKDLLSNAPVTSARIGEGGLSVEALCAAALEVSDNTAANLLLSLIGGPAALTDFFRSIGDPVSRLDRMELELNANLPDDPRDTTTPDAMLGTLRTLLLEDEVLSAASRERIIGWMRNERNGRDRIRRGLPPDWQVANKPGTGGNGAANDIAIAWPPGRAPILFSIYISAAGVPLSERTAAIAQAARAVASNLN